MLNQQALEGNWNQVKGKVREKWGQFTEDDLETLKGHGDQLVGAIQKRTGEARDKIEKFLTQAVEAVRRRLRELPIWHAIRVNRPSKR